MSPPIEFWHVRMPTGTVSTMTLDELDSAYQAGTIDEQVYVLKQGESQWATLASLLGLDESPASATPPPAVISVAPPAVTYSTPPPVYSLRPVVSEIDSDLDLDSVAFRPAKKKSTVVAATIAAAVAAGIAIAALTSTSPDVGSLAAASQPPPQPAAVAPPFAAPAEVAPADRFNDNQKRALIEADKARAAQQKAKMNAAAPVPHRSGYKSDGKPVFHKGGDKYDPLNSTL
jgi:hypothetical protein